MGDVDELHLFEIEQETIPEHTHNLFAKFNPAGKRKRRDLTFQQKLAMLKWMDFAYPNGKYNFSDISRKISLDRKTVRQMVGDGDFIQGKVDEMKHTEYQNVWWNCKHQTFQSFSPAISRSGLKTYSVF